jgi:hypothetical protein
MFGSMNADERRPAPRFLHLLGRRYFLELALIIAAKLVVLCVIYFVLIAPQPRADTSSAAIRAHITDSSAGTHSP